MKNLILLFIILQIHAQQLLQSEQDYRINSQLNQFQPFCFLAPKSTQYDVKLSFLGSIGIDMEVISKTEELDLQQQLEQFTTMDTKKLRIHSQINQQYCFYVVAYSISPTSIQITDFKFDYILSYSIHSLLFQQEIEEVYFDDLPPYALYSYLSVIFGSLFLSMLLAKIPQFRNIFRVGNYKTE